MLHELLDRPAGARLRVTLDPGEVLVVDRAAIAALSRDLTVEVAPSGGALAGLQRAARGSSARLRRLTAARPGQAVARLRVTSDRVNGHAIAHGGYVFLLADTAFACACNAAGPATVAAGADIVFVAPAREGDVLTATAAERVAYGRSGVYDVTVRRVSDGEVIAEFRGGSRSRDQRVLDDPAP